MKRKVETVGHLDRERGEGLMGFAAENSSIKTRDNSGQLYKTRWQELKPNTLYIYIYSGTKAMENICDK